MSVVTYFIIVTVSSSELLVTANTGLIRKKFCIKTCSCYDVLSNKSCEIVKRKKECGNVWAIRYCHLTCHKCFLCTIEALGMQSKAIPDSRITALSMYNHNYAPSQGRLHYKSPKGQGRSGSWSAKTNQAGQWIQVDLGKVTKVSGIATQGRYDADQWVTGYTLQYSIDGKVFMDYKAGKVLAGNKDRNTVVMHDFHTPIITRYIRVVVKSWTSHISMRMELYGCK
ncbi:hypothetical protein QZH41_011575 [Actinostola sp. cb2023]|nr:hypothetical protein QZH41_011575 [Actinostola sp. cb2023]